MSSSDQTHLVRGGLTLFLGGARSGKSDLVVALAKKWPGDVTFVATADTADASLTDRITKHAAERPATWDLLESPRVTDLELQNLDRTHLLIVDCVTVWVSNLMLAELDEAQIVKQAQKLARVLDARPAPSLLVSNEVGLGVHPPSELGTKYRDILGRVNTVVAEVAPTVMFVVAGRAVSLPKLELGFGS